MIERRNHKPPTGLNDRRNLTSRHRLKGFDYQNPGYYFVTICTHNRQNLFGEVSSGQVNLSEAGNMLASTIRKLPDKFPNVLIDSFVIMPNHLHLLIYLPLDGSDATVSEVARMVKGVAVAGYRQGVLESDWPRYQNHLWQQGFNDQIIRDDRHLDEVRRYISENPVKWEQDEMYE